jgi:hypothetical protein
MSVIIAFLLGIAAPDPGPHPDSGGTPISQPVPPVSG